MGKLVEYYELKDKYKANISVGPGARYIYVIGITYTVTDDVTVTDDDHYITWEAHLSEWTAKEDSLLFRAGLADDIVEALSTKMEIFEEVLRLLGHKYTRDVFSTVTQIENTL